MHTGPVVVSLVANRSIREALLIREGAGCLRTSQRLKFLFEIVSHVFMRGYSCFPLNYCGTEFSVLCVFSLCSECAQCFRVIGDHILHVCLIKIIARKPRELIQLLLVISIWARWRRQAPRLDKGLHARRHLRMLGDHLLGKRLHIRIRRLLFRQFCSMQFRFGRIVPLWQETSCRRRFALLLCSASGWMRNLALRNILIELFLSCDLQGGMPHVVHRVRSNSSLQRCMGFPRSLVVSAEKQGQPGQDRRHLEELDPFTPDHGIADLCVYMSGVASKHRGRSRLHCADQGNALS